MWKNIELIRLLLIPPKGPYYLLNNSKMLLVRGQRMLKYLNCYERKIPLIVENGSF